MNDYLIPLVDLFEDNADWENAMAMAKYLRDQFAFLGIKMPQRRVLVKQFVSESGLPPAEKLDEVTRQLWAMEHREFQYTAQDFLGRMKKVIGPHDVSLIEHLIVSKSWWDTVDGLASHQVGNLISQFPELKKPVIGRWRGSDNFWLRRTTLLFQLRYKDKTDVDLLFSLINENLGSREFFINKAIGWALREYSKTDAAAVIDFVGRTPLEPLSEREALKWLKNKGLINN